MILAVDTADPIAFTGNHPGRPAAGLLVLSFLIGALAAVILFGSGASSAFAAGLAGELGQQAPYAGVLRLTNGLYALAWIVLLAGSGLLARLLLREGSEQLPILAIALLGVATVLGVLEATFHMSITIWAAGESAGSGSVPDIYAVLRGWISSFKLLYMSLAHLSLLGFALAILRTGLLPAAIGWTAVAWSAFWFLALVILHVGFPALVFVMPPLIGVALWKQQHPY